jgi:hypothetical protein
MLDVLKRALATQLTVPTRRSWQQDRELLAIRFDRFASAQRAFSKPKEDRG